MRGVLHKRKPAPLLSPQLHECVMRRKDEGMMEELRHERGRMRERIRQFVNGSSSDWVEPFLLSWAVAALMGAWASIILQLLS